MRARPWLGWWLAMLALWGLLVATVDPLEWAAGAVAATVAATAAEAVRAHGQVRFRASRRWLAGAWRLPAQTLRDTGLLVAVLWRCLGGRRPPRGQVLRVPWPDGGDQARDTARRTLVVASLSLTPNVYAIDVEDGSLLLHRLVPDRRRPVPPSLLGPP